MRKAVIPLIILLLFAVLPAADIGAMPGHGGWMGVPHGDYCGGPHWGWYGSGKAIRTPQEAKEMLDEYFKGKDIVVGTIRERGRFFQADIKENGNVIDRILIDKRTGRLRSIY